MFFHLMAFQLMYKKELDAKFDAGVAIDSIFLENCHLPQPPESGECVEGQWKCNNTVVIFRIS